MSSGVAVDFSALSKAGTSLAAGLEADRKSTLLQALGGQVQAGDYAGAAKTAFDAGDLQTGLSLVKLGDAKAQSADFQKQFGGGLASVLGGGTGTPDPVQPVAPAGAVRAGAAKADRDLAAFKTSDPVAADLGPQQKALLNAIAGGESGGKYNVRYTPRGGALFDLNGQHPGIAEAGPAGPSTAAGRYQFTKSTWDRLGGGDFSPENQDRKALQLAEMDYRSRTGRDLNADLNAEGFSPRIQKALAPTWAALGGNTGRHAATYAESLQRFGSGGAPSGRVQVASTDPNFVPQSASASAARAPSFSIGGPNGSEPSPATPTLTLPAAEDPVPVEQRVQVAQAAPQVLVQAGMKPAAAAQFQTMQPGSAQRVQWLVKAMAHPAAPEGAKEGMKALLANELQMDRENRQMTAEQKEYNWDVANGFKGDPMAWRAAKASATRVEKDPAEKVRVARRDWQALGLPNPEDAANAGFWKDFSSRALGGGALVNVDTRAEGAESTGLASARIADSGKYQEAGQAAAGRLPDIAALRSLGRNLGVQGAEASVKEALAPFAQTLGIKLEGIGDIQAYQSVIAKLTPNMRPPGSGATSDFEQKMYGKALPGLLALPETRELVMDMMEAQARGEVQRGDIATRYRNGEIDKGAYARELRAVPNPLDMFKKFRDANPTVVEEAIKRGDQHSRPLPRGQRDASASGSLRPAPADEISLARAAIAAGAPQARVLEKMRARGFDPSGL